MQHCWVVIGCNISKSTGQSTKPTSTTLDALKARYADLYKEKLGTLSNFKAQLHLKENTAPIATHIYAFTASAIRHA